MKTIYKFILIFATPLFVIGQEVAVLKYNGGGDWYSNPTALTNLIQFCNTNINTTIKPKYKSVEVGSAEIHQYPFVHMTGHGNVHFTAEDAENLRQYLLSGGFLHIDDNYGMDTYIRKELLKVFPKKELIEVPSTHHIFNSAFSFPKGLPKIHEHDNKKPLALGYFHNGKLICLYTTESDLGDGWENPEIHNDPEHIRLKALQMGANIITYAFNN
ncbi:MAG: DUF4159 domain-containing protein [Flavobacteriaceae bacterium]